MARRTLFLTGLKKKKKIIYYVPYAIYSLFSYKLKLKLYTSQIIILPIHFQDHHHFYN